MNEKRVPEGYMENALGHLVPLENVSELDKLRDETVRALVAEAEEMGKAVAAFRAVSAAQVASFVELCAQEHGVELGGKKGNVTLTSYDGSMRVVRARADQIAFNEAVRVTREMVFRCIAKWSEGANANLAKLVTKAFETDKNGHLSASNILGLRQIKVEGEPDWKAAMDALDAAIQVMAAAVRAISGRAMGSMCRWGWIAPRRAVAVWKGVGSERGDTEMLYVRWNRQD